MVVVLCNSVYVPCRACPLAYGCSQHGAVVHSTLTMEAFVVVFSMLCCALLFLRRLCICSVCYMLYATCALNCLVVRQVLGHLPRAAEVFMNAPSDHAHKSLEISQ